VRIFDNNDNVGNTTSELIPFENSYCLYRRIFGGTKRNIREPHGDLSIWPEAFRGKGLG
jgi:hypothetical protein